MKPSNTASPNTEILSRTEWESLWNELDENKTLPFHQYAEFCTKQKQNWLERYSSLNNALLNNGRYVVYLERVLQKRNRTLPQSILRSITFADIPDAFAFPLLRAQISSEDQS